MCDGISKDDLDKAIVEIRKLGVNQPAIHSFACINGSGKFITVYTWAPISTAPRDGTRFLMASPPGSTGPLQQKWIVTMGAFDEQGDLVSPDGSAWSCGFDWYELRFTEWMPLPERHYMIESD